MIIRGICCLRPGVPGVSENIQVQSVVGRFLEHSRVYFFHNDGDNEIYGSSADLMPRNLFHRVEEGFPVEDPDLKLRMVRNLELHLADNARAWQLQEDGNYVHLQAEDGAETINAQERLLRKLSKA